MLITTGTSWDKGEKIAPKDTPQLLKSETRAIVSGTLQDYYELKEEKADYLAEGLIIMSCAASLEHERGFRTIFTAMCDYCREMSHYEVLGPRFTVALGDNRFEPDVIVVDPSGGNL